ncbi:MAG: OadG family protein [Paludibacteraceae bacterium]|nr:OadG family protein [Paludibacteraceae bacterium]
MNTANFTESLQLMGIGLATVFCVLLFIIFFGNVLIKLVNKFFPEEVKPTTLSSTPANNAVVDAGVAQAINAAIMKLTNGKSKANKIERL